MDDWLDSIIDGTGSVFDWVGDTLSNARDSASNAKDRVVEVVDRFYQHLKQELSGVTSYFKSGYESIKDAANSAWHESVDAVQKPDRIFDTALARAQSMASNAVSELETIPDLVKALTNWTIGFVTGLIQGFFATLKYGIEEGWKPVKGFFHASAAGVYETMKQIGYIPVDAFNAFWSGLANMSEAFGPFAPLFVAAVIFSLIAAVVWLAKVVPPWIVARVAERG